MFCWTWMEHRQLKESVAIAFSMGSSQPRDRIWVSHVAGRFFTLWDTRETPSHWGHQTPISFRAEEKLARWGCRDSPYLSPPTELACKEGMSEPAPLQEQFWVWASWEGRVSLGPTHLTGWGLNTSPLSLFLSSQRPQKNFFDPLYDSLTLKNVVPGELDWKTLDGTLGSTSSGKWPPVSILSVQ